LIEPISVIPINTINLGEELNGSETTPLEEITHPKNPSIMSQKARSSIAATMQLGGTRTSSGTDVPNFLIHLITIYVDEKISCVSLITPVPITEEGEPRETSALTPKSLTSIPQEGDDKAIIIMDTKFLDQ
jgi:hypothetical protein